MVDAARGMGMTGAQRLWRGGGGQPPPPRGGGARQPPPPGGAAPSPPYRDDDSRSLSDRLDDYEKPLLSGALDAAGGSVAEAARRLRTDRANLYRRMRRLGIDR